MDEVQFGMQSVTATRTSQMLDHYLRLRILFCSFVYVVTVYYILDTAFISLR